MNVFTRLLAAMARRYVPSAPEPRVSQVPVVRAGMHVDHDRALTYSAVYACVRVIAETIATLPWRVMRRDEAGRRVHMAGSPVETVLTRAPNPEMTPFSFRSTLVAHALTWGNGYAEIERDAVGRARRLWPIPPDRVEVKRDPSGALYYRVYNATGHPELELGPEDVFHLTGLGFDGVQGYSVVSLMARSVGLGLAAEEFGAALFGNGAMPNSVLKHPATLSPEAHERLAESIRSRYSGPSNAGRTMILEEGMAWEAIGIPPEDAQFLETRKFQVQEIARWFRVPPHKLADLERATFSNIEHQSREFVQDTILPWTVRLEQEADRKLFGPRSANAYTKLNVNALMRGDSQARADYYSQMAQMGVLSVNDIRELEDLDPIGPEGDKRLVQLNMTTLEKVGEEPAEQVPPDDLPDTEQNAE